MQQLAVSFTLDRPRNKLTRSELLCELEFVAARLGFVQYGKRDFRHFGKFSVDPILNEFGNWTSAMIALGARLRSRGIEIHPRKRGIPEATIFAEMERIWLSLGHRPSRAEWHAAHATVSCNLIRKRFDGWRNAAAAFINYKNDAANNIGRNSSDARASYRVDRNAANNPVVRNGLRAQVLIRDCSTCCICGRNPKTHPGLVLHVDHIRPFSKGGKTVLDNLQTTCEDCNLGKGAQDFEQGRCRSAVAFEHDVNGNRL
jgi:5-methylcytosine-specific restriction endonuclease McrA